MKELDAAQELQDLEEFEEKSNKELESRFKVEEEIEEYKETIASSLMSRKEGLTVNIDSKMFVIGYKVENNMKLGKKSKILKLIVIDVERAKLSNKKKGQTTIALDYVTVMNLKSNLMGAIEAWLRNLTGTFKAEHKNE